MPSEILDLVKKERITLKDLFRNWDKNNSQKVPKDKLV